MGCIALRSFWLMILVLFHAAHIAMSCPNFPACSGEECESHTCSACPNCTECLNIQYDCPRSNVKCNCIGVTTCERSSCDYSDSSDM
ncbi:hypothetical protein AAVH_27163 [Aphelenchoides avenae]|nr:hypothetical protein AAVH_27163 [Aphelenchus avenae]